MQIIFFAISCEPQELKANINLMAVILNITESELTHRRKERL